MRRLLASSARRMKPTEAAWLAGLFDGEGSLVMDLRGTFACVLCIVNTNMKALKTARLFAGCGGIDVKRKADAHHKPQWKWRVSRQRDVVLTLEQLLPYLVIKRQPVLQYLRAWKDV